MPFLLPALSALASDAVVVFLGRFRRSPIYQEEPEHLHSDAWVYAFEYFLYLASLRIILLLGPLLFHSYTGTALRCSSAYYLLYYCTLLLFLIQMLGLAVENPESLETLLPIDAPSSASKSKSLLFYEMRRLWWSLVLSLLSTICHLILLEHVRSTAPFHQSYAFLSGGSAGRRAPSVYYQLRQYNPHAPASTSPTHHTDDDFMHTMSDFMEDLQDRLRGAKAEWSARLDDFTTRISASSHVTSPGDTTHGSHYHPHRPALMHNPLSPMMVLTPFRVLLQLFAYQDVLENGKLDFVFDIDDGISLTFWVPQLLSFLLHGALESSPKLEEWILDKCRRNVQFAHRCYWFLRAWCLEVPPLEQAQQSSRSGTQSVVGTPIRNDSNSHLNSIAGLGPFLDEPAAAQLDPTGLCNPKRTMKVRRQSTKQKFLFEERVLIERLMLRVKECGEISARILEYGPPQNISDGTENDNPLQETDTFDSTLYSGHPNLVASAAVASDPHVNRETQSRVNSAARHEGESLQSPSILMNAVEMGLVPINPSTGCPSVRHLDAMSSHHKYGFLPLEHGESSFSRELEAGSSGTEQFDKTPRFLDSLLFLAERLFEVPEQQRREELQRQLQIIECDTLPDNAIYMPIGNSNHRVWRIVPDESFPLGTKERVPCIVTLEVVAFEPKRIKPGGWSFLPRRGQHLSVQSDSTESADHVHSTQSRWHLPEAFEMDSKEIELLFEWRHKHRDPYRRTAFLDKVTGTMKGATDKVSAQVRDRINMFRERSASDEMRSLTMAEAVLDSVDALTSASFSKIEAGEDRTDVEIAGSYGFDENSMVDTAQASGAPSLSRNSSYASLASMGQWSSPHPKTHSPKHRRNLTGGRKDTNGLGDSESSSLQYGSDHGGDQSGEPQMKSKSTRQSRADQNDQRNGRSSVTRPPVVFRESWQTKENRIRQKSAYGSSSGWRLLPVLIKANDDLRQEQLASQLIYRMAAILARERINVWLCPYEIIALTDRGGIIEAIPDTISLDSLKRNDADFSTLKDFFISHFGSEGSEEFAGAQANFVESLAAYSIVCYLLQIKDRHNGNILLDNQGHVIHIDFGFFFLSSPGSNVGFESAPFKLTKDFVELLGGPQSRLFRTYRELCIKTFIALRRHCMEIILMVEMLKEGNEELNCFRGRPDEAIRQLRDRFRLDLNDRACRELVNFLIDDSIENWRTDWYDRYQRSLSTPQLRVAARVAHAIHASHRYSKKSQREMCAMRIPWPSIGVTSPNAIMASTYWKSLYFVTGALVGSSLALILGRLRGKKTRSFSEAEARSTKTHSVPRQESELQRQLPPSLRSEQISRTSLFFKDGNMTKLSQNSRVCVVGVGGVGSHTAVALARAGVGPLLRLIDFDQVTLSSLNRHACATLEDVGIPKVDCVRGYIERICPRSEYLQVETRAELMNAETADRLLDLPEKQTWDLVVDAIDDVPTKAALIFYCIQHRIPVISCMGAGGKADLTRLHISDLQSAAKDPLATKLRQALKRLIKGASGSGSQHDDSFFQDTEQLVILYSSERTVAPLADLTPEQQANPHMFGTMDNMRLRVVPVLGTMPAIMGMGLATICMMRLGDKPLQPVPGERVGRSVRHRVLQHLKSREERIQKRVLGDAGLDCLPTQGNDEDGDGCLVDGTWIGRVQVDMDDIDYLFELWKNRCAVTGARLGTVLELARWKTDRPATVDNLVLMSAHALKQFDEPGGETRIPEAVREIIEKNITASCQRCA